MSADPERPLSPDEALPPVQPPSAGFIVQLFVVPAVIVSAIVLVWLLFNWLAQMGDDPRKYLAALERDNVSRWQVAVNLANALRNPRNAELRNDPQLAKELVAILERDLAADNQDEHDMALRLYLCKALGEFEIGTGAEALAQVARQQLAEREIEVRLAALESLSLLAANVGPREPELIELAGQVLSEAAKDNDPQVRTRAAYGLGVLATDGARETLALLLQDASPYVRCNAANGLARSGDPRSIPVLVEMLDPELEFNDPTVSQAADADPRNETPAALVQFNALRAASQLLAAAGPEVDVAPLVAAVEKLAASKPPGKLDVAASEFLQQAEGRSASTAEAHPR
jgi:HEAT repeat protein